MAGDASAYAALGLAPGADAAAIEQAYRKLIKVHHPDREGGDAVRAAEINLAYRQLRRSRDELRDPLEFNEDFSVHKQRHRGWIVAAMTAAAGVGALLLVTGPAAPVVRSLWPDAAPAKPLGRFAATAAPADPMDQPLKARAIDAGVREALQLWRSRDEMALTSASRDCQRRFRSDPGLTLLDRCVAFDDAVVQLEDRDPLRDQGPFSQLAVTGRQWSAASSLSDDSLAIDGRLDRIRLQVEIVLAPAQPAPVVNKD
ncbi:MAG TPA: J domain-containing protein [Sphingomicrobium sp.]